LSAAQPRHHICHMPTRFAPVCGLLLTQRRTPQICALDMTCEAVVTKMAYLLSLNVPTQSNPPCPQLHCFEFEPLYLFFSLLNSSPPPSSLPRLGGGPQLPPSNLSAAFKTSLRGELTGGTSCEPARSAAAHCCCRRLGRCKLAAAQGPTQQAVALGARWRES
jgi:hypothetical protein